MLLFGLLFASPNILIRQLMTAFGHCNVALTQLKDEVKVVIKTITSKHLKIIVFCSKNLLSDFEKVKQSCHSLFFGKKILSPLCGIDFEKFFLQKTLKRVFLTYGNRVGEWDGLFFGTTHSSKIMKMPLDLHPVTENDSGFWGKIFQKSFCCQ